MADKYGRKYNVDPKLLLAQIQVESGGNANAVSSQGAQGPSQLMPATARALGVSNAFDPSQAVEGQAKLMAENLTRYGTVDGAVSAYHGGTDKANWGPKTADYLAKVQAGYGGASPKASADPLMDMANGVMSAGKAGASAQQDPLMAMASGVMGAAPAGKRAATTGPMTADSYSQALQDRQAAEANGLPPPASNGALIDFADGLTHHMANAAVGGAQLLDHGTNWLMQKVQPGTDGAQRSQDFTDANDARVKKWEDAYQARTPTNAASLGGAIAGEIAPFLVAAPGKAVDMVAKAPMLLSAGKNMLMGGALGAAQPVTNGGENYLSDKMMQTGIGAVAAPIVAPVAGAVIKGGQRAINYVADTKAGGLIGDAAQTGYNKLRGALGLGEEVAAPAARVEPTMAGIAPAEVAAADANRLTAATGATESKPRYKMNTDGTVARVEDNFPQPTQPLQPASVQTQPVAPVAADAAVVPGSAAPQAAAMPQPTAPASGGAYAAPPTQAPRGALAVDQQQSHIDTLKALGLEDQRASSYTGDKRASAFEYQQSKANTPTGNAINEQLRTEQAALKSYGAKVVSDTGAAAESPEAIGQAIRAPLQALDDHYQTEVSKLYTAADERAGGLAIVKPNDFTHLMDQPHEFAGTAGGMELHSGIKSYLRFNKLLDSNGGALPMTVEQSEGLRKYLNRMSSPANSRVVGSAKEALDSDVTKAGGADIYEAARALHAERKNTLENPKGIGALMNEAGPDGINKSVSDEGMTKKLITMPTAQFSHVVETLRGLPDHLKEQGQSALNEIKGALAKRIYEAGDKGGTQNGASAWNAANVTRELNAQRSKMEAVFSPDELAQFKTLHDAGHILQAPSSYAGAPAEAINIGLAGAQAAARGAGAGIGVTVAGPMGALAGDRLGSMLGNKFESMSGEAAATKFRAGMKNPQPKTMTRNEMDDLYSLENRRGGTAAKAVVNPLQRALSPNLGESGNQRAGQ